MILLTPSAKFGILGKHPGLKFDVVSFNAALKYLHKVINCNIGIGSNEATERLATIIHILRHVTMK